MLATTPAPLRGRRPRAPGLSALVVPIVALVLAPALWAQSTATFDVSGYVPQPILVAAPQGLRFGRLLAGDARTVAHDEVGGRHGRWSVTGAACAQVELQLTLPATLGGAGGELAIGGWSADWMGGETGAQPFAPTAAVRARFDHAGAACSGSGAAWTENGTVVVRLGGTVHAAAHQPTGLYTGTVTLQVTYVDF